MPVDYLFADMNSFFASVEQQDRPELRGKPVAVVPVQAETTSCIAASPEAKRFGVRTGTKVFDARKMCPGIRFVVARHRRYVEMHHKIVAAIESVLPVEAVMSVDEMLCRLVGAEREVPRAEELARAVKAAIKARAGNSMRCSVGLGPNRLLAKVASDMQKPDGLTVVEKAELPGKLLALKPVDFPGIGPRMERRFLKAGVATVRQLYDLNPRQMSAVWGSQYLGETWYRKLRGEDIPEGHSRKRTLGHSKVLAPHLRNEAAARAVLMRLADKAAARLRHDESWTGSITVSASQLPGRWDLRETISLCRDTLTILKTALALWDRKPAGTPVKIGVTFGDLVADRNVPRSLFEEDHRRDRLSEALDKIRGEFGLGSLYWMGMRDALDDVKTPVAFQHVPDLSVPGVGRREWS